MVTGVGKAGAGGVDKLVDAKLFVVVEVRHHLGRELDPQRRRELAGAAGVLRRDHVGGAQRLDEAGRGVADVAQWGGREHDAGGGDGGFALAHGDQG